MSVDQQDKLDKRLRAMRFDQTDEFADQFADHVLASLPEQAVPARLSRHVLPLLKLLVLTLGAAVGVSQVAAFAFGIWLTTSAH